MIPHVIVLEPGLVIHKIYNGYWFSAGLRWKISAGICAPLRKSAARIGIITTPAMRAAWKEGREELFYPYGKPYVQTLGEPD
jgi:hypothetical protein